MKIIVGLGNPGEKYENTRHNLGFRVVDEIISSSKYPVSWEENKKFKAFIAKTEDLIFVKPLTYMNNSGLAVSALTTYYKIHNTDVIVIHDELDLPLGKIKIRQGGAAAGHHGVESVIEHLGTDKFIRVRLGIDGNIGDHFAAEKYVVENFKPEEKPAVKKLIKNAVAAVELLLEKGLDKAQNQYN